MLGNNDTEQLYIILTFYEDQIPDVLTKSFICKRAAGVFFQDVLALAHITAGAALHFSTKSQRWAREMNSFLTFARNAGKLLVSWSRLSRTGRHSSAGSLDTTAKRKSKQTFSDQNIQLFRITYDPTCLWPPSLIPHHFYWRTRNICKQVGKTVSFKHELPNVSQ